MKLAPNLRAYVESDAIDPVDRPHVDGEWKALLALAHHAGRVLDEIRRLDPGFDPCDLSRGDPTGDLARAYRRLKPQPRRRS